ncbi:MULTISPECIES: ester cyclase [unclassified Geodermatophilus]
MDAGQRVLEHFTGVATGDSDLAGRSLHPTHVDHTAAEEPPACSLPGLPGLMATSAWLRLAFADLRFEIIETAAERERIMAHVWMRGRQHGPLVVFPPGGRPVAFPPTGREFAARHCHVFRLQDGLFAEHIEVRDDLGLMTRLGHLPPTPAAMIRMARWQITGAHGRAVETAIRVSQQAADTAKQAADSPGSSVV